MGLAHVTVRITNLSQNGQPYDADFLVETGAIDCMVPSDELRKAEVRPERKKVYELANGQPAEYEIGFARVLFMGEETVAQVIFSPSGVNRFYEQWPWKRLASSSTRPTRP